MKKILISFFLFLSFAFCFSNEDKPEEVALDIAKIMFIDDINSKNIRKYVKEELAEFVEEGIEITRQKARDNGGVKDIKFIGRSSIDGSYEVRVEFKNKSHTQEAFILVQENGKWYLQ